MVIHLNLLIFLLFEARNAFGGIFCMIFSAFVNPLEVISNFCENVR